MNNPQQDGLEALGIMEDAILMPEQKFEEFYQATKAEKMTEVKGVFEWFIKDHTEIKKQIHDWEKALDSQIEELQGVSGVIDELNGIATEMYSINF